MLPNALTLLRLASVPLILWLAAGKSTGMLAAALVLFLLAGFTDWLDGYVARRCHAITPFGIVMDPVTDKILLLGVLFIFQNKGLVPLWLVLLNVFRELFVSGIRQLKAADGKLVGANWMGKLKFCLQVVMIALVMLYLVLEAEGVPQSLGIRHELGRAAILYLMFAMTLVSLALALKFFRWHSEGMLKKQPPQEVASDSKASD